MTCNAQCNANHFSPRHALSSQPHTTRPSHPKEGSPPSVLPPVSMLLLANFLESPQICQSPSSPFRPLPLLARKVPPSWCKLIYPIYHKSLSFSDQPFPHSESVLGLRKARRPLI